MNRLVSHGFCPEFSSFYVFRNCLMTVDDILFEKLVTSGWPRGEEGSDVRIISAYTISSGFRFLAKRASFIISPPFFVS